MICGGDWLSRARSSPHQDWKERFLSKRISLKIKAAAIVCHSYSLLFLAVVYFFFLQLVDKLTVCSWEVKGTVLKKPTTIFWKSVALYMVTAYRWFRFLIKITFSTFTLWVCRLSRETRNSMVCLWKSFPMR